MDRILKDFYIPTNAIAKSAKRIPKPCLIEIVSFKNMTAKSIDKTGYRADKVTIFVMGPLLRAYRNSSPPNDPRIPVATANEMPIASISTRNFSRKKRMIATKILPKTP